MPALRFAVFGTGYWAQFQIPAWFHVGGVQLIALYNRTISKAEAMADRFGVPRVYDDPEALFSQEELDFIDIITQVDAHADLVFLAAKYGVPVICQKPMGPDYETCVRMVEACHSAGIPLLIHENYRWQAPVRLVWRLLHDGTIGDPFRAHIQIVGFSPSEFEDQPALKQVEHLTLADLGSHILDVTRFLFGEPQSLYCQHHRTRPDIVGEDVASVMLRCGDVICHCEMSHSTRTEWDHYPDMFIFIEGTKGSLELGPDFVVRVTTDAGTHVQRCLPPAYSWADPDQRAVHASIVDCNQHLLRAIKAGDPAETTGMDNLKTMQLVYGAYESAAHNQVLTLNDPHGVGLGMPFDIRDSGGQT